MSYMQILTDKNQGYNHPRTQLTVKQYKDANPRQVSPSWSRLAEIF